MTEIQLGNKWKQLNRLRDHADLSPNSITPTLQQSTGQVPDKVADVSWTQIMKVRDTNHVADFHDLCRGLSWFVSATKSADFVANFVANFPRAL